MKTFQKWREVEDSSGKKVRVKGLYINTWSDTDSTPEHAQVWIEQDPNYLNGITPYYSEDESIGEYKHAKLYINKKVGGGGGGTGDFTDLENRPKVAGTTLGNQNIKAGANVTITNPGGSGDIIIAATGSGSGGVNSILVAGKEAVSGTKAVIPAASIETAGVVRADGSTIKVDADGIISADCKVQDVRVKTKGHTYYDSVVTSARNADIDLSNYQYQLVGSDGVIVTDDNKVTVDWNLVQSKLYDDSTTHPWTPSNIKTVNNITLLGGGNLEILVKDSEAKTITYSDPIHYESDSSGATVTFLYDDSTIKVGADGKTYVPIDNVTIKVDNGKLVADVDAEYIEGEAIRINNVDNSINVRYDNDTIVLTSEGRLKSTGIMSAIGGSATTVQVDSAGQLVVDANTDYYTVKVDASNRLYVPIDNDTIVVDSQGKVSATFDTIVNGRGTEYTYKTPTERCVDIVEDKKTVKINGVTNEIYVPIDGTSIYYDSASDTVKASALQVKNGIATEIVTSGYESTVNVKYDDKTIKLSTDNKLELPIDNSTIYIDGTDNKIKAQKLKEGEAVEIDSENKINVLYDNSTIVLNSEGKLKATFVTADYLPLAGGTMEDGATIGWNNDNILISGSSYDNSISLSTNNGSVTLKPLEANGGFEYVGSQGSNSAYIKSFSDWWQIGNNKYNYLLGDSSGLHLYDYTSGSQVIRDVLLDNDAGDAINIDSNNKINVLADSESIIINSDNKLALAQEIPTIDDFTIIENSEGKIETCIGGGKKLETTQLLTTGVVSQVIGGGSYLYASLDWTKFQELVSGKSTITLDFVNKTTGKVESGLEFNYATRPDLMWKCSKDSGLGIINTASTPYCGPSLFYSTKTTSCSFFKVNDVVELSFSETKLEKVDNEYIDIDESTIVINSEGKLSAVSQALQAGEATEIVNNQINVLCDGDTIRLSNNKLESAFRAGEGLEIASDKVTFNVLYDNDTIVINSEGKLEATAQETNIDEKTILFNSEGEIETCIGGYKTVTKVEGTVIIPTTLNFNTQSNCINSIQYPSPTSSLPDLTKKYRLDMLGKSFKNLVFTKTSSDTYVAQNSDIQVRYRDGMYSATSRQIDITPTDTSILPTSGTTVNVKLYEYEEITNISYVDNQYIKVDNSSIVVDSQGALSATTQTYIDEETIVKNSEGKLSVPIDEDSIIINSEGMLSVLALSSSETLDLLETFKIVLTTDGNGTVTANKTSAKSGETITLTPTPNAGYTFNKYETTPEDLQLVDNQFTMLYENVYINALFTNS